MTNKLKIGGILAATVGMVFGLSGCKDSGGYEKYDDAKLYQIGTASFTSEQVKKIEIDWCAGSIEIEKSSSTALSVMEEESVERDDMKMHYYLDGNILKIQYCQSGLKANIRAEDKNLRVVVPAGASLDIDSESALVTVGMIEVTDFSLENDRGDFTAESILCERAEIDMESGKASIGELIAGTLTVEMETGDFAISKVSADSIAVESESGAVSLGIQKPTIASVDTSKGDVTVTLGADLGASVSFTTARGKFYSDKESSGSSTNYEIEGSQKCRLEIKTISGNLYIA